MTVATPIVPEASLAELAVAQISARLRGELPEFMVPHWIQHIPEFPLGANRKVDRDELARRAQLAADQPYPSRPLT